MPKALLNLMIFRRKKSHVKKFTRNVLCSSYLGDFIILFIYLSKFRWFWINNIIIMQWKPLSTTFAFSADRGTQRSPNEMSSFGPQLDLLYTIWGESNFGACRPRNLRWIAKNWKSKAFDFTLYLWWMWLKKVEIKPKQHCCISYTAKLSFFFFHSVVWAFANKLQGPYHMDYCHEIFSTIIPLICYTVWAKNC